MWCRLVVITLIGALSVAACSSTDETLAETPTSDAAVTTLALEVTEPASTTGAPVTTLTTTTTTQAPGAIALFDPDDAETCAELADMFVESTQRMFEVLGTRSDADMEGDIPPEIVAASEEIGEWFYGSAGERVIELCPGGATEFETLVCAQASSFEALGEAAERHLRDNVPPCDQ